MAFKKIVVGLDQSFQDSIVFARALEQAKPHVSTMMIVHTLKYDREPMAMVALGGPRNDDARDMYSTLQRRQQTRLQQASTKAHDWLEMYFQQAIAKGIPAQIDCRASEPGLWLCEVAQRWGADLIVIGHRESQGVKSVGANSVTQYVLQHAHCSVLIANGMTPLQELPQTGQLDSDSSLPPSQDPRNTGDLAHLSRTPVAARLPRQMLKI